VLGWLITGGAQLNGLAGWRGFQPVPTSATQLGTLLMMKEQDDLVRVAATNATRVDTGCDW